jgi:2-keto-4-pentenoate hydratase
MTPVSYIQLFASPHVSGNDNLSTSDATPPAHVDPDAVAAQFVRARLAGQAMQRYPGSVPDNLATAYSCQDKAIERWPDRLAGWKVARIPPPWFERFREERLIGPVFQRNVYRMLREDAVECGGFIGGLNAVEAELIIRVSEDAPPAKTQWTVDEAASLVAALHIGMEFAASPLSTLNDLGPAAVVSDFGNNWGVIVGPAVDEWRTVDEIVAASYIDGVPVGRGKASVRNGALAALAFTLGKAAGRGRPLRAGAVISTGMITGVHDIRIGQRSRHVFERYGAVQCCVIETRASVGT